MELEKPILAEPHLNIAFGIRAGGGSITDVRRSIALDRESFLDVCLAWRDGLAVRGPRTVDSVTRFNHLARLTVSSEGHIMHWDVQFKRKEG